MVRSFFRLAASAVPVGVSVPILTGPLAGMRWYAGAGAGDGKGLSTCFNLGEPKQLRRAAELSRGKNICFDIGANVGLYSLLFSRNAKSVFALEPLLRNLYWLYRVLDKNKVGNVTVVPAAVSSSLELALFQQGENCSLGRLSSNGIPVPCVSVDGIAAIVGMPDVIKIDVEGAELSVLRGAENVLCSHHPAILLSTHGEAIKLECVEYLSRFGYKVEPLDGNDFCCQSALPKK